MSGRGRRRKDLDRPRRVRLSRRVIQVDVAMSVGFGSGLALAAHRQLRDATPSVWQGQALVVLVWFGIFFVPHAMYLIWAAPAWHTMFVAETATDIPAWVVGGYAMALVGFGLLGFAWSARHLRTAAYRAAWFPFVLSFVATFGVLLYGWDGTGYVRFLYPGTGAEWNAGVAYPPSAFFSGPVAHTIAWILPAWLVPYLALVGLSLRKGRRMSAQGSASPGRRAVREAPSVTPHRDLSGT